MNASLGRHTRIVNESERSSANVRTKSALALASVASCNEQPELPQS